MWGSGTVWCSPRLQFYDIFERLLLLEMNRAGFAGGSNS